MKALGTAAAAFDRAMVRAARFANRRKSRAEGLSHDERMRALAAIRDAYGAPAIWTSPDAFFAPPEPIHPELRRVREMRGGIEVLDASWPSRFEPYLAELRNKYLAYDENRTAHARLFVGASPRPAIVLIHGYLAGQWSVEERAWPIRWLLERYDLAIAVLLFDLRSLVRFLRARGAPSVGVMGMSLGGYTTSLLATVERDLAFAVPIIPLASLADFALEQGRLGTGDAARAQHAALEEANRIVSPFARPSLVPKDRVLIVAAAADHITPPAHAERLARHFDARLVRFEGGHLLQFGRGDAFRAVGRWLSSV
jgi:pimeloyl-ACP methyl ester carboxylesterase